LAAERALPRVRGYADLARDAVTARRAPAAALAVMVAVSVGVRIWFGRWIPTPWIMVDELVYSEIAKSFAAGGHLLIRGTNAHLTSAGYPILISPAWLTQPIATAYGIAKAINAVAMTLAAVPVFAWTARLTRARVWPVVAAALVLLMPALVYTGNLMTENAFFPTFVLAAFAIAVALERPTLKAQLLALAAIAFASAFRIQGVVLLVVYALALALKLLLDRRAGARWRELGAEVRRFWPTAVALALLAGAYLLLELAQGKPLASGLGMYQTVAHAHYSVGAVARWTLYHFAELPLAFGVIPASAFLVLLALAVRGPVPDVRERAFLAVTTAAVLAVVVEVAAFASRFSFRVEERYMFELGPLFLIAFVVWLDRGLPRPWWAAVAAAAVPAALLATLPLRKLLNISIFSDTFGLIPFLRQSELHGLSFARGLLVGGAVAAGLLFLLAPRRAGVVVLPAAVAVFLSLTTHSVEGAVTGYARGLSHAQGLAGDPSWIDDRVGDDADVGFLYGVSADPFAEASVLWQTEFWNRSVGTVYTTGTHEPVGFAESAVALDPKSGRLATTAPGFPPPYLATRPQTPVTGRRLAAHPPLELYRTARPLRLAAATYGVYGDGWSGADATYIRYATPAGGAGHVFVTASRAAWGGRDVPGHVRIQVVGLRDGRVRATRRWVVHSKLTKTFTLPTPRPPWEVLVHVRPTFSPSAYGLADTRKLGVQLTFAFLEP
jgi:hypothetical protein